jgi:anti-anti-sigma factor
MTIRSNGTLGEESPGVGDGMGPEGGSISEAGGTGALSTRTSSAGFASGLLVTRLLRCGRTLSLQLRGVLNWRTAAKFRHDVGAGLVGPYRRVVLDLSGIEYVGGDILRELLDLHGQLSALGVELRLVVPEGNRCARSMALTGLDRRLAIFARPEEAWQHRPRTANEIIGRVTSAVGHQSRNGFVESEGTHGDIQEKAY